jgi:LysR family glycine cleavage system transcriptional activator
MGGEIQDWEMWLRAAGAEQVDFRRGPRFTYASFALQAAIEGQGVALAAQSSAGDDLAAGRLICPFDIALPGRLAYFLVYPRENAELPKVAAFRDWVLAEAGAWPTPPAEQA